MSTWEATADSRIQVRCLRGIGYQVRWEIPVPATRIRCDHCRKDLVPKKNGDKPLHKCARSAFDRGYMYPRKRGNVRTFGTRGQAEAIAWEELGLTTIPEQIASRKMLALAEAYQRPNS